MILELVINGIITDSNLSLTQEQKSSMLGELSTEFEELWNEIGSPISAHVGINNAVSQAITFNSFEFYKVAYAFAERTFKRLVRMKATEDEHSLISYQALYEQELKEQTQAKKEWEHNNNIDMAIQEVSAQIKKDVK